MTRKRTYQRPAQTPRQRRIAAFRRIGNDYLAATELAELAELAAPAAGKLCTATGCTSGATYTLRGLPMCSRHGAAALDWPTRQD